MGLFLSVHVLTNMATWLLCSAHVHFQIALVKQLGKVAA